MKKLILSIVVVLFMNTMYANTRILDPVIEFSNANDEISQLLNSYPYLEGLEKELIVKITFILTEDNEVLVLRVDSENEDVERFIRNKLHYKKLVSNDLIKGTEYIIPVKFEIQ